MKINLFLMKENCSGSVNIDMKNREYVKKFHIIAPSQCGISAKGVNNIEKRGP
jgi:hypothetical protein